MHIEEMTLSISRDNAVNQLYLNLLILPSLSKHMGEVKEANIP